MKLVVLALALGSASLPTFASPLGCNHGTKEQTAQISCADGQVWDAKAESCVTLDS
jgi:hypothetical protein